METEAGGEEDARGNMMMPQPPKKEPALTCLPAKRPPRLLPKKLAGDLAIALTALRPQERQALHRPPIPPPLPQRQAPRSPAVRMPARVQ